MAFLVCWSVPELIFVRNGCVAEVVYFERLCRSIDPAAQLAMNRVRRNIVKGMVGTVCLACIGSLKLPRKGGMAASAASCRILRAVPTGGLGP
jgi:hypothetical protein